MEDPRQSYRPTPDPTLVQCIEGGAGRRGTGLPVGLVCQIVSEVAVELDSLHSQGRAHGDVRAERIAVPLLGTACLLEPERPTPTAGAEEEAEAVLHSLSAAIEGDVTGLVAAAYFALSGTPPGRFFPLTVSGGATRRARLSFPFLPGRDSPRPLSGVFDVLGKGLGLPRGNRYASAGGFAAALQAAASPSTVTAAPRPRLFASPIATLTACARLAPAGVGLLALGMWLGHRQTPGPISHAPPAARQSFPMPPAAAPVSPPDTTPRRPGRRPAPTVWGMPQQADVPQRPVTAARAVFVRSRPTPSDAPAVRLASAPRRFRAAPPRRLAAAGEEAPGGECYLRVYARQFVSPEDLANNHPQVVCPRRVLVDGRPSTSLAAGRWTPVAPGVHRLAFYPAQDGPFDPNANFRVRLVPGRQALQIPLPRHLHAVLRERLPLAETAQGLGQLRVSAHPVRGRQPEPAVLSVSSMGTSGGRHMGL